MRPRASRLVPWPAAALLAVVTAGCGSHGAAPASAVPASTTPASAADQRAAEFAILRLADMGPGYRQMRFQPTAQIRQGSVALSRCIGRPPGSVHQTAQAFSEQLSRGSLEILSSIIFVSTRRAAQGDLAAFQGPKAPGCLRQSYLTQYERTGGKATASIGPLRPRPASPAASADYRLRVLAQTTTGSKVPVFIDVVRVVRGRAEVTATFQDVNQAVPEAVERRAISAMLGRL
jgi:hypothetical protein